MFDHKQSPSPFLCIRSIDIINIGKCPACTRGKDRYHADNAGPEQLFFQPKDYGANFYGIDLPAQPIDGDNCCRIAAGGKVVDKSDYYGQCFFHVSQIFSIIPILRNYGVRSSPNRNRITTTLRDDPKATKRRTSGGSPFCCNKFLKSAAISGVIPHHHWCLQPLCALILSVIYRQGRQKLSK